MRYLPMVLVTVVVVACGDGGPTDPGSSAFMNVQGEYAAVSVDGESFPVPTGETALCGGGQVPEFLHGIRVGLYDDNPDASATEGVFRARLTGAEDGSCPSEAFEWGLYQATADSLRFSDWNFVTALADGAWTEGTEAFTADTPDGMVIFEQTGPAPTIHR